MENPLFLLENRQVYLRFQPLRQAGPARRRRRRRFRRRSGRSLGWTSTCGGLHCLRRAVKPKPESRWWWKMMVGWLVGWLVGWFGLVAGCLFFFGRGVMIFLKGALLHLKWQSKVEKKRQKKLQEFGNCDWLSFPFLCRSTFLPENASKRVLPETQQTQSRGKKGRIFLACSENHQTQNSCLGRGYVNHPLGGSSQDRG